MYKLILNIFKVLDWINYNYFNLEMYASALVPVIATSF